MKLQIEVLDVIRTGMVEIPNETYYSILNNGKFFYGKERKFEVVLEPDNKFDPNAVLFSYNGIPMGYMIREHALQYNSELKLMKSLSEFHKTFKYWAICSEVGIMNVPFGKGASGFSRRCHPVTIYCRKD